MKALASGFCVGLLVASWAATAAAQTPEDKGPTYRQNRGQIVFAESKLATPDTEKDFAALVRKARRQTKLTLGADGQWSFHFIAFLREPPRADRVNLVWYRYTGRKSEQVDYLELVVPPTGVTLRAQAALSTAEFKAGDQLEARITRLIDGKEKVYARCRLTLK
jgi:hypothetical protein